MAPAKQIKLSPSHARRKAVTAKAKGTGLGLALSRIIIEAHGGEITATTGARGGSAFRMWLPNS